MQTQSFISKNLSVQKNQLIYNIYNMNRYSCIVHYINAYNIYYKIRLVNATLNFLSLRNVISGLTMQPSNQTYQSHNYFSQLAICAVHMMENKCFVCEFFSSFDRIDQIIFFEKCFIVGYSQAIRIQPVIHIHWHALCPFQSHLFAFMKADRKLNTRNIKLLLMRTFVGH